jgi:hypothetical protein
VNGNSFVCGINALGFNIPNKWLLDYSRAENTSASSALSGSMSSFTTSGTYTKVTQLIPVKIKLTDNVNLTDIIGTNATVKIKVK